MTVEPLLPVTLGNGRVNFAPGMRAGSWVFASGHMAQDYGSGIAASVLREGAPNAAGPRAAREAARVFDNVEAVLAAGGATLDRVVRTDQYYTTVAMVPPYQAERRRRFGELIPPSTSIVQQGLLLPGAALDFQAIAVAGDGPPVDHIDHETLRGQPTSGYSAALAAGGFVFVPGNTAMAVAGEEARNGVAAEALIKQGLLWGGERLRLETGFIVTRRLLPSLELVGLGPADVVKAQIYLTDPGTARSSTMSGRSISARARRSRSSPASRAGWSSRTAGSRSTSSRIATGKPPRRSSRRAPRRYSRTRRRPCAAAICCSCRR